ncbi:cadherin domain-containing protein [Flammeovirga agarivorans]|uniref:T9SS type A sorting domain-containing protein n=1 Tax=Flammeovirga agarivorans TaxID=2726742 RepID=A0A7X8XVM2_9BACT|nr:cadherin domain-containing protein [Flammeovirga agarivorans]NLR91399.1 T9SS type A sorting domain-containing protein [Flammeovirga agarivorans]
MDTTITTFRTLQHTIFTLLLFMASVGTEAALLATAIDITANEPNVDYYLFGRDQNGDTLDDSDFISEGTHTDRFAGKFSNTDASDWITLQNNSGTFLFNGSNGVNKQSWMGATLNFDILLDQSYNNTYVPKIIIICMNNGVEKKYIIDISDQVDLNLNTWQNIAISFTQEKETSPTTNSEGVITGGEYQNTFANNIAQNAQRFKAIRFTTYYAGSVTQAKFKLRDMHVKGTFEWETQNTSFVHKNENNKNATMIYRYSKKARWSDTDKIPAFIFLHGNGGGDNALGSDAQWSLYERPIAATKHSSYIFEPKSGNSGGSLSDHQINEFLDHIISNYNVDPDRIYLGGFSAGGIVTSRFLTTDGANRLAAAYFINGAMLQSLKNYQKMDWSRVTNLSTWIINNLDDPTVPHNKTSNREGSTSRLNNVLVANGANNVLRLHESGAHSIKIPRNFSPSFLEFIYSARRGGTPINTAPSISDATFNINENSAVSSVVGTVSASDPESDVLTFSIVSGNSLGAFQINATSGKITVADNTPLDFETNPSFKLTIQVSDGEFTDEASIIINLNDIDENTAPSISDTTFSINENSAVSSVVGTVSASDPEEDDLTFSIVSGNGLGAFQINSNTGEISVNDNFILDFETNPSFQLTVQVSDGKLSNEASITINLNDIDENTSPSISDATFIIDENSDVSTVVCTVSTFDNEGDDLTFSIVSGNDLGAFKIDSNTGEISVNDNSILDFETNPSFQLTIQVNDGEFSDKATITIHLNDVDDTNIVLGLYDDIGNVISVYPNPTYDFVNVDWSDFEYAVVYNLQGKEIITSQLRTLDLRSLNPDVYLVNVFGKNSKRISLRVLKK